MLSSGSIEAARAVCRQLFCSIAVPKQIPLLAGRRPLARPGCRLFKCSNADAVLLRTMLSATRLPSSRHCSQTSVLLQLSNPAAFAICSWPLIGPDQPKCLGWPSFSSFKSHQRNRLGQPSALANCSRGSCIVAGIGTKSATAAGLPLPLLHCRHHRGPQQLLTTTTPRANNIVTAAGARRRNSSNSDRSQPYQQLAQSSSSLDIASTSSGSDEDEEFSTGEKDLSELPRYYVEAVIKKEWAATEEEKEFWTEKAEQLRRNSAVRAVAQLDPQWRFGVSYHRLGGLIRPAAAAAADDDDDDDVSGRQISEALGNAPSGSLWFRRAKTKDPFAVVLVKVGAFYECVGYDAALLMEYGGYNPMGGLSNDIPRAGCPDNKIQEVLQQLVEEAGFSVAVWEEEPDTKEHGSVRKEQRPRKFAQLVTPENPSYLYGLSSISQDRHAEAPNLKGITVTSNGCSVFVLNRYSDVISVYHGISTDSLWSLLVSDGSAAPVVYLHWPLDAPKPSAGPTSSQLEQDYLKLRNSLQALCQQLEEGDARVSPYYSVDPLLGFKDRVRQALRWPAEKEIPHLPAWDAQDYWPGVRPLYHSTLLQLGLIGGPGVPCLAEHMLARDSGKLARRVVRGLLINPPPYDVATATRRVVRRLYLAEPMLYDASGSITPQKVALILEAGEGNEKFFQNLLGALNPVIQTLDRSQSPALSDLVDNIWPLLCHTMGCQPHDITRDSVLQAAQQAVAAIKKIVAAADSYNNNSSNNSSSTDEDSDSPNSRRKQPVLPADSSAAVRQAVESFSVCMELYKQRVLPDVLKSERAQVDDAFWGLLTVLEGLVRTLTQQAQQAGLNLEPKELPRVHVDEANLSVWIKVPAAKLRQHIKGKRFKVSVWSDLDAPDRVLGYCRDEQVLHHPYDRNGCVIKARELFSCNLLDEELGKYRDAITNANTAATEALQTLSRQLSPIKLELSAAAQLGILLHTLYEHSKAAKAAGWAVPAVGMQEQLQAGVKFSDDSHQHGALVLKGLQPYWMGRPETDDSVCDEAPVRNDVELEGFMLLTGPNMAGKSTVLRSTAAAALCGSVGLAIPAAAGSLVPQLDAIMLRTFTGDAPSEQLSAFGVEMSQMACVLADARPGSLVLIDELGKGTEVGSGTALASAMLKELTEMRARGIFATHLHGLMDLTARTPRLANFSMQVTEQTTASGRTRLAPTWHLVPGFSTESLALEVARDMGLPDESIVLAQQEYEKVKQLGGYKTLIRIAAEAPVVGLEAESTPAAAVKVTSMTSTRGSTGVNSRSRNSSSGSNSGGSSSILSSGRSRRNAGTASSEVGSSEVQAQQHQQHSERISQVVAILSRVAAGSHPRQVSHSPEQPTLATAAAAAEAKAANGLTADEVVAGIAAVPAAAAAADDACSAVHHLYRQGAVGLSGTRRTAGNQPPVAHLLAPVLYVAYFEKTGKWHAGVSTQLAERWKSHTYRLGKQRVDMWYVVLDTTDSGIRSQLEGRLHLALDAAGVPLDSKHDAHRARRK